MATISVTLTAEQIVGIKDHFDSKDEKAAVGLTTEWLTNHLNQWYADFKGKDIATIKDTLTKDPSKIDAVLAVLQPK
jgi:hypothetical protein